MEQVLCNSTPQAPITPLLVMGAYVSSGDLTNATAIGCQAVVDASNKVRIGNSQITVIEGQVPYTIPSDARFKFNVQEDVKGLDFILRLRPVTYQFDGKRLDDQMGAVPPAGENYVMQAAYNEAAAIRRTGFIAQEVEKAASISGYNFSGIIKPRSAKEHYALSYESFGRAIGESRAGTATTHQRAAGSN
jgi:hypothetical protein